MVEVTSEVLRTAEIVVANHPLRTLDAFHVASAQLFAARMTAFELTFVSADTLQSAVAASIGLPPKDIGSYAAAWGTRRPNRSSDHEILVAASEPIFVQMSFRVRSN